MKLNRTYSVKAALVALVPCIVAVPVPVFALGVRIPDQDAAATARGDAFAATADNPSAIYYNPAGISQLEGQHVSLGGYGVVLGSHFESAAGPNWDTKTEVQAVPQVFYTAKCPQSPLSFGLGFYSPYGLSLEWPASAPFSNQARKGEIQYLTLNPVLAWQVLPSLSIAAGPTLNWSKADLNNNLMRFRGQDVDAGFNAGILWKPLTEHAFGVNYRSATDMKYDGHTDFAGVPFSISTTADYDFPQNIVIGYSFRPTTNWNFEVDADWTDWETLNTLNLRPTPLSVPFNWRSSWFYEFGATRYFEHGWSVSGGYIYSENSIPDATFSPLVPDSDRHIFSVGVGKKYEKVSWNVAYQLAWGPERNINNPANPPINGSYEFISNALIINFGFWF